MTLASTASHALNNLEYGHLQLGQDTQARRIIEQINTLAAAARGADTATADTGTGCVLQKHGRSRR